jgi:hypothetical protein
VHQLRGLIHIFVGEHIYHVVQCLIVNCLSIYLFQNVKRSVGVAFSIE